MLLAGKLFGEYVTAVVEGKDRYVPSGRTRANRRKGPAARPPARQLGICTRSLFLVFDFVLGRRVDSHTAGRQCSENTNPQFCVCCFFRRTCYEPVNFFFLAQAKNAISQLSETELMGRPILVRQDRGDSGSHGHGVGGAAGAKVYVGNLSWEVQWQDLKDHMRTVRHKFGG